jgi:hypothetical protein
MTPRFCQPFQERGKSLSTFGKYIRAPKSFLGWCESNDLSITLKFHKFHAPGVTTATAALGFFTEETYTFWCATTSKRSTGNEHYRY